MIARCGLVSFRPLLLALFVLAAAPAGAADRLRLVLDSGWVVPLSGDGRRFDGEPQKLDLPTGSGRLYRFEIDAQQRRLYVTPQLPYGQRGTAVFDLKTLKRLGFMPGVTEVTVPVDPAAPWFVAHSYVSRDTAPDDDFGAEQLRYERATAQTIELRARRDWSKIGATAREVPLSFDAITLWQCYSRARKGFIESSGRDVVGDDLKRAVIARAEGEVAAADAGRPRACWPNGEQLLARWTDERSGAAGFLARDGGGAAPVRVQAATRPYLRAENAWLLPLGGDAHYAVYASGDSEFTLFDFERQRVQPLRVSGNAGFAHYSADRRELYLTSAYYEFHGATESNYIEGMYGGADYGDEIYRIRIGDDDVHSEKLELPAELQEINERAARLNAIDDLGNAPEEYKQEMRDAVPPLGPLGQKLKTFAIVGVIAD
jgi:hypothetical protein